MTRGRCSGPPRHALVCRLSVVELPERYGSYFDLIIGNPDLFPGLFHTDLKSNVLPKLRLLRQFGSYPSPDEEPGDAESCGAHSPRSAAHAGRIEPQELATRAGN